MHNHTQDSQSYQCLGSSKAKQQIDILVQVLPQDRKKGEVVLETAQEN